MSIKLEPNQEVNECEYQDAEMMLQNIKQDFDVEPSLLSEFVQNLESFRSNEKRETVYVELQTKIEELIKEKKELIAKVASVRTKYQRTYFDLKKKEEAFNEITTRSEKMEQNFKQ